MRDNVLIGTFINANRFPGRLAREIYDIFGCRKVFVFKVKENDKERFLLTFNIGKNDKNFRLKEFKDKFKNTLQLHRNKQNNTLYTINSLNKIVSMQNLGNEDKHFEVDWESYKNSCLLLGSDDSLRVLSTKLQDIIEI